MYKKLSNIFIMFLSAAFLQASEPYVKKDVKEIERNGKKLVITEQHVLFENGKIRYVTLTEKGKNEILYSKYGDYFFGLEFGRPAGSNGGWDFWNFLNANPAGRSANVLATFAAEKVNIIKLNDCTMAEFIWPLSADGNDGKVFMKVMQFPSHKDWLFINLKIDHSSLVPDLGTIAFAAYPGNSDKPRERELWLATKEKNYCLSKNATSFTPA
ncbi:MAG: hypothetical protein WCP55_21820, partial [Lentisphaerota bacterium]